MRNNCSYLIGLLDQVVAPWAEDLRQVLLSAKAAEIPVAVQQCTVRFALAQALRRSETSRSLKKQTFGIEGLIKQLRRLDEDVYLDYYVISTAKHLGTCYVLKNRLLGCEFVLKDGTKSKPRLWIDDKPIA
jgi:hypothetical protein